jgi:hypothetical protein
MVKVKLMIGDTFEYWVNSDLSKERQRYSMYSAGVGSVKITHKRRKETEPYRKQFFL